MATRIGRYTLRLDTAPSVAGFAAVGGKKEGEGPMGGRFDILNDDTTFGTQSWEKAESAMQKQAVDKALGKAGLSSADIEYIFAGDLINQCTSSIFGLREMGIPFIGLFGACSTMAESLALASLFMEGGFASYTAAVTSSHFCTAERQFRSPLEYGAQRPPSAQWTVTGAGAAIVGRSDAAPYVRAVTIGAMEDLGIKDANNMGAAMAPAAAQTLSRYFDDTCTSARNYDAVFTGDLGRIGSDLMIDLLKRDGWEMEDRHMDCGLLIYDPADQDVGAGGSGCGCSATMLCCYILNEIRAGRLKEVLFVATGALMSPLTVQQGESIPGVAHLLHLSAHPR